MTGTDTARGAARKSRLQMVLIAFGIVVLLALGVWAFSLMDGADNGSAPGGPTGPNTSKSQRAPTSAGTEVVAQTGSAAIDLTPRVGPDSRNVLVRGSQFGANEEVVVSVDGTEAKRVQTDSSGAFTASLTVSFAKSSFVVSADGGSSNRSASGNVTFETR